MTIRYRLRIANREVIADVLRRDGTSIAFDVNGHKYEVTLESTLIPLTVPEPQPMPTAAKPEPESASPRSDVNSEQVRAPMPGIVAQVLVELGQQVSVGDPLLVLEAMKMENSVLAQRAGTVKEILVSKGTDVQRLQVLMLIAC